MSSGRNRKHWVRDGTVHLGERVEQVTTFEPGRRCKCGALLSIYNPGDTCGLCEQEQTTRRLREFNQPVFS